jgi:transcriptional regulator with XRE-family HTH domain
MDLALEVGVSPRHLSFVETGRAKASPELLLALAEHLEVPLRERNLILLASGYAPRFSRLPLNSGEMAQVHRTLQRILAGHDPYPGLVIDRYWNVVLANRAAERFLAGLPEHVIGPELNVFRMSLHPDGLAARTVNFEEWARYLLGQLHRSARLTGDVPRRSRHRSPAARFLYLTGNRFSAPSPACWYSTPRPSKRAATEEDHMPDLETTIATYLDAWNETDPELRDKLIEDVWAYDGQLIDPPLAAAGRAQISGMAATLQAQFPGHQFRRSSLIDEHHGHFRFAWQLVAADGSVTLTGLDVGQLGEDGHLAQIVGFFGEVAAS